MNQIELIAKLTSSGQLRLPPGQPWRLSGPYSTDPENERFLRAIARGLAAGGYAVRLVRTTEAREDLPL